MSRDSYNECSVLHEYLRNGVKPNFGDIHERPEYGTSESTVLGFR